MGGITYDQLRDTVYPVQYSDHRPIAAEVTLSGS
jgi:hypothetical protein